MADRRRPRPCWAPSDWQPTADEVAAIVAEMRPIIRAHADRCSAAMKECRGSRAARTVAAR